MRTILQWPLGLNVLIVAVLSASLSALATFLVRRKLRHPEFAGNNELVGFTYAVYGLIYGVLMAFVIITAWERYADTEQLVLQEATILSELWRDSQVFPDTIRDTVHDGLFAYTRSVADDEWQAMAESGRAHPLTEEIYGRLWELTYLIEPETNNQQAYFAEFLSRMNELSGTRRLRLLYSRLDVNRVLWMVLLVGAIPTVAYTLLFSTKHAWVQVVITGFVLLIVLLCLLVTLSLQHPFSGDVSIQPEPFRDLLESFQKRMAETPIEIGP